ncbi:hypothetical protein L211DRAFT_234177 [Terfezia boudieri ATCC MYA-4762]|uniref:Uncharacterized protein n=1 Tax=Terfezia boudieri ATCC MYA-4762 TaxID=1051890 RepID=A0A3N4LQU5_9PEZI|nr:hypothetical protein L211DRAFT_234177 [Terfezia boudieri ATCC MYA-4762]
MSGSHLTTPNFSSSSTTSLKVASILSLIPLAHFPNTIVDKHPHLPLYCPLHPPLHPSHTRIHADTSLHCKISSSSPKLSSKLLPSSPLHCFQLSNFQSPSNPSCIPLTTPILSLTATPLSLPLPLPLIFFACKMVSGPALILHAN